MKDLKLFEISEFAKYSGVSRRTLIYYDSIGIFCPERIGKNGYRYYSVDQFETIDLITSLKFIGIPLKEIKEYIETRTPEKAIALFKDKIAHVDAEIKKLRYIRKTIKTRLEVAERGLLINPRDLFLEECEEEWFVASEYIEDYDTTEGLKIFDDFYNLIGEEKLNSGYPIGSFISWEDLKQQQELSYEELPFRLILSLNKKRGESLLVKPKGHYVSGYFNGMPEDFAELMQSIFQYIETNNLTIVGDVWEYSWIDEIATRNPDDYLKQVAIQVREVIC